MNVDTFLEQFGHLADAPDGIKKLRELILDLAVRGKLVEQNPEDEPANILLRKIKHQKQELIKKGEVKKLKSLPTFEVSDDTFELPVGWEWTRLNELVQKIGAGSTPRGGRSVYCDAGIKFLRSQNVWNDGLRTDDVAFIPEAIHQKMNGTVVRAGDILLNITGASIGRCSLVSDDFDEANVSQHVTIVRMVFLPIRKFVHTFMISPSFFSEVMRSQVGISREGLSISRLREFQIPLPPLAEQKRIVAKVDELMALCDELETQQQQRQTVHAQLTTASLHQLTTAETARQLTKAWRRIDTQFDQLFTTRESIEKLRQTILQLAVQGKLVPQDPEDEPAEKLLKRIEAIDSVNIDADPIDENELPFNIPSSWEWSRTTILFDVAGGITKNSKRLPKQNHFPYLRVANVQRDSFELDKIERFELFNGELERWKLVPNDLLIVEGNGSEKEIGRCAIWNGEIKNCVHQNHLIRCRPRKNVEAKFSLIYFNSPSGMNVMKEKAITTSGLYSLSVGKVRSLVVPLPPREEQTRIVAKVKQLMAFCEQLERDLEIQETDATNLTASMTSAVLNNS